MARRRLITDEQRARIRQVVEARRKLPSDKQLAREAGCSVRAIRAFIERMVLPTIQ